MTGTPVAAPNAARESKADTWQELGLTWVLGLHVDHNMEASNCAGKKGPSVALLTTFLQPPWFFPHCHCILTFMWMDCRGEISDLECYQDSYRTGHFYFCDDSMEAQPDTVIAYSVLFRCSFSNLMTDMCQSVSLVKFGEIWCVLNDNKTITKTITNYLKICSGEYMPILSLHASFLFITFRQPLSEPCL